MAVSRDAAETTASSLRSPIPVQAFRPVARASTFFTTKAIGRGTGLAPSITASCEHGGAIQRVQRQGTAYATHAGRGGRHALGNTVTSGGGAGLGTAYGDITKRPDLVVTTRRSCVRFSKRC
jgi:hypothetical protein